MPHPAIPQNLILSRVFKKLIVVLPQGMNNFVKSFGFFLEKMGDFFDKFGRVWNSLDCGLPDSCLLSDALGSGKF